MIRELEPRLFRIHVPSPFPLLKPPVNLYLFAGEDGLLWDAGYGRKRDVRHVAAALKKIETLMTARGESSRVTRILISHGHGDHFAGLESLRRITGAQVMLTWRMAAKIASRAAYRKSWQEPPHALRPLPPAFLRLLLFFLEWAQDRLFGMHWMPDPDVCIPETGILHAGGRVLRYFPIPGHAEDHLALYVPAEGLLMSGDHVLRSVTPWMGPPGARIEAYETSLEKLAALPLRRIFPAHGSPVEHPRKHLQAALSHSRNRTRRVMDAVSDAGPQGISLYGLLNRLYPRSSSLIRFSAEGWVLLTLRMLAQKGSIRVLRQGRRWRFKV